MIYSAAAIAMVAAMVRADWLQVSVWESTECQDIMVGSQFSPDGTGTAVFDGLGQKPFLSILVEGSLPEVDCVYYQTTNYRHEISGWFTMETQCTTIPGMPILEIDVKADFCGGI